MQKIRGKTYDVVMLNSKLKKPKEMENPEKLERINKWNRVKEVIRQGLKKLEIMKINKIIKE